MIQINTMKRTYVCPFCGHTQAYSNSYTTDNTGYSKNMAVAGIQHIYQESSYAIYTLSCQNSDCQRISVTAINRCTGKQIDLVPQVVIKTYPDYIPQQIRDDYSEATTILQNSPKAAATLYRRCLQGMIRDFWGVQKKNLNEEIAAIEDKVPPTQWTAIDSLRKLGNIGAHMEKDVNLIVDISSEEAFAMRCLIELLLDKWYIARHEEEALYQGIAQISAAKAEQRKGNSGGDQ